MRTRYSQPESPPEPRPRVTAALSSARLVQNFHALSDLARGMSVLPMVKANAYGHGLEWAVNALKGLSPIYGFGVATLEEGAKVRSALTLRHRKTSILVFSGCGPFTDDVGRYCEYHSLTPVLGSDLDFDHFVKGGWHEKIPYELKFNTGMNRLGLSLSQMQRTVSLVQKMKPENRPLGICTHMAQAETPESKLTQTQVLKFRELRSSFSSLCPQAHFHFGNSASLWNAKALSLEELSDAVRVGISLYGITPWQGAPQRGILPVMMMSARVLQVRTLKRGETIGYGATYKVSDESERVAILSAGYGDGVLRTLSSQTISSAGGGSGQNGQMGLKVLGRISMDLMAVAAPPSLKTGDEVELLGDQVPAWNLAVKAGTIPYEILTSVGARVQRKYDE